MLLSISQVPFPLVRVFGWIDWPYACRRPVPDRGSGGLGGVRDGIVPVAVLIVIFQERVVSGLTSGGIKG